jgi:uncharacterized lipoprotein
MKLCSSEPKCRNSTSSYKVASVEFFIQISKNLQNSKIEQNINELINDLRKSGHSFSYNISYKDDMNQSLVVSVLKSGREKKIYFLDSKNIERLESNNNNTLIEVLTEKEKNEMKSIMKSHISNN